MLPPLRLFNTLTRSKDVFAPIDPANVRLYVCGPTVYDFAHIGNARPLIVFDVLFRLLRHRYGAEHVTYVRNITDVDDKINARAAERGISIRELTDETNRVFQEDARALGCLDPTHQPRATEYVAKADSPIDMIRMIARLIEAGHAYSAEGHVLFSVPSMPDYGRLSRRPLDEMIAGARVDVAPYKRADTDFVLWKPSRRNEPGWDSPWGFGRPGWHLECSAMSAALLGDVFDIHGGGIDLVFPHHENEIAQSRCCFGTDVMANVWMHNGFLQVEGAKMSKSAGNFVTIHDLLRTETFGNAFWAGPVLRLAMLSTHYRQPIDWTVDLLTRSRRELWNWCQDILPDWFSRYNPYHREWEQLPPSQDLVEALGDDLNTPAALTELRRKYAYACAGDEEKRLELLCDLSFLGVISKKTVGALSGRLTGDDDALADVNAKAAGREYQIAIVNHDHGKMADLFQRYYAQGLIIDPNDFGVVSLKLQDGGSGHIERLLSARTAARARKDWKESDRIRDELAAMGIVLKDNKDGTTTWEVKR